MNQIIYAFWKLHHGRHHSCLMHVSQHQLLLNIFRIISWIQVSPNTISIEEVDELLKVVCKHHLPSFCKDLCHFFITTKLHLQLIWHGIIRIIWPNWRWLPCTGQDSSRLWLVWHFLKNTHPPLQKHWLVLLPGYCGNREHRPSQWVVWKLRTKQGSTQLLRVWHCNNNCKIKFWSSNQSRRWVLLHQWEVPDHSFPAWERKAQLSTFHKELSNWDKMSALSQNGYSVCHGRLLVTSSPTLMLIKTICTSWCQSFCPDKNHTTN